MITFSTLERKWEQARVTSSLGMLANPSMIEVFRESKVLWGALLMVLSQAP